ncbi:MAG: DNA modification methylase [Acidobacteria bacterium]|nr:MAG: DNA modification methylase [Acidobacteriota bacterium]
MLEEIVRLDHELARSYKSRLIIQSSFTRSLVSFQANKTKPLYRWYKYKEAFSAPLIEHLLARHVAHVGRILDPFAGSGTALFVASAAGLQAEGIELLPIGQQIISVRKLLEEDFTADDVAALRRWATARPWESAAQQRPLLELRITRGAYPKQTQATIESYMCAWKQEHEHVQSVLRFALLCVLESISYTRKDGQYLRWDYRSDRRQGQRPFDKGQILTFNQAICAKLNEIVFDLETAKQATGLFPVERQHGGTYLYAGSCFAVLPTLPDCAYDAVITSPPYCNRYDYTRTYALELALLGVGEKELTELRQQMLSCTVENRAKDLLAMSPRWGAAIAAADAQELLQSILHYLNEQKAHDRLNNNGIPRMVRGYFYEMACVIAECARVLKPGAPLLMVNDNVRYAGASISVDLILSAIAESIGFHVEKILVLPSGKGNSSQQMGQHGREPARKCVYVWRKA